MCTDPNHIYCRSGQALWFVVCLFTLWFPEKYLERLEHFHYLAPNQKARDGWRKVKQFSDKKDDSERRKQQGEWDRLNIAVSVITATSAASLAIQAAGTNSNSSQVYWLATGFYSAAFGMSLQGLILITYLTISAGGSSDELIGRISRGVLFEGQPIRPIAFTMALPSILAVYSAFALMAGLVAMIVRGPCQPTVANTHSYIAIAMVPIGVTFVCLCVAFVTCEYAAHVERRERQEKELIVEPIVHTPVAIGP